MPKYIDKIEERINKSAFNLFGKNGYNHVTMKMVAEDIGISVGTLYNYYSDKQDLFISAFKISLDQIYFTLSELIDNNEGINEFIKVLYAEVDRLKGFSREIIRNKLDNKITSEIKDYLLMLMKFLIYRAEENNDFQVQDKYKDRFIRLILLSIYDFSIEFPDDEEGNIDFICKLIEKLK